MVTVQACLYAATSLIYTMHRRWLHGGTARKLWEWCLQVAPTGILLCHFWRVKMYSKIWIYHYATDKSCADFSL